MTAAAVAAAPWLSSGRLAVLGTGAAVPGSAVGTDALVGRLADRFGLMRQREAHAVARRMAIETRHICRAFDARHEIARPGDANPDLVARAVTAALADAGLTIGDIGYLVGHTTTPLQPMPSNIALAADRLGYRGPHVELRQACTGFANALMIAFGLLAAPDARPVVLVGSETGSLWFDPDRAAEDSGQLVNMIQMGDGAAAIVLGPPRDGAATLHSAWFGAIGLGMPPGLQLRHGVTEFDHDFAAILASGSRLFDAGAVAAARHGIALDSVDVIVPHQVSGRIGAHVARHFGIAVERTFANAGRLGNTGSAAIWMALAELRAGGMQSGARMLVLGAEATKYMYGGFAYDHC
jgi:3-oxoacyl-[acyl-carrier-protein] synthase III